MGEPLYDGRTSREIMKDLAYTHLIYDEPRSLLLEDWCQTPNGKETLPHRIVAKMVDDDIELSELTLLMSWCLTCNSGISPIDIKSCVDIICETQALKQYHSLTYRLYEEFKSLFAVKQHEMFPLEWNDITEPQLTSISNMSCLNHPLQECIHRYLDGIQ
jgi:hypothetical protein